MPRKNLMVGCRGKRKTLKR